MGVLWRFKPQTARPGLATATRLAFGRTWVACESTMKARVVNTHDV